MSYGVPVIASKRPAMTEILGDAAQFFDPDNVSELAALMERLLTSKEDKEHLKEKGMAQANRYGIKENAEIILNAMEAAITA
jgi:glycosyltransferase involved in cell wall biosynthesis